MLLIVCLESIFVTFSCSFFSKEYSIQNSSIHSMLNDVLYTNIYYFFSIKINDISTESSGRRSTQSHLHCHLNVIEREKKATNIFFGIMCARASKLWWRCVFNKYFVDHSSSSCIVLFVCLFVCDEIKSNGTSERGVWLLNGWRDYREKDN